MKARSKIKELAATFVLLACMFIGGAIPASASNMDALANSFDRDHWIAYSATHCNPVLGPDNPGSYTNQEEVRKDLTVLKNAGFTGICTYGVDNPMLNQYIPDVCKELNMKLIVGVWDVHNQKWLNKAAEIANKYPCIVGICIGNEGGCVSANQINGGDRRYTFADAAAAINQVKSLTAKPVSTCEQFEKYSDPTLLGAGDFLMPNIHPFWNCQQTVQQCVDFTVDKFAGIRNSTSKVIMCKEVGLPTAGDGGRNDYLKCEYMKPSVAQQTEYYKMLAQTPIYMHFMYFEAFDGLWKAQGRGNAVESHWGLWDSNRNPKPIVSQLPWK